MTYAEEIKDCMDVVDILNNEFYDKTKNEELLPFAFLYATHFYGITYFQDSNFVWSSEDDTRICRYNEETGEDEDYEPLIDAVRRSVEEYNNKTLYPLCKKGRKK
jgi:hypothetical protein